MRAVDRHLGLGLLFCALLALALHSTHLPMTVEHVLDHSSAHTVVDAGHDGQVWAGQHPRDACAAGISADLARKAAAVAVMPQARTQLYRVVPSPPMGHIAQLDAGQSRDKLRAAMQVFRI
ncbi:hypothetical protein Tter_2581 [Thermobaculum terrenum ATCC BAA-798]|uniref:Uncharacterized protein n=1 Tax=Thermobaculum terrenum (strain ATCC BAA-798 / CCMEE 7001 / YNP1) TaxID=525904 RepID=D1CI99_THET1|nr:hypothetical protein [Thermobaculum terrenum]ACZ43470.1 hypothetical protein Tter_2581 [Thermobaculum terrenum ATCC BAA-798]